MVLLTSSQTYLEQSSLLISARPTTTRITTHYSLPRTKPRRTRAQTSTSQPPASASTSAAPTSAPPSAILTLKTYDPVSGVVLQYKTNRAAEVGRLMGVLGRLGCVMARGRDEKGGEVEAEKEKENVGMEERGDGKEEGGQSGNVVGGKGKRKKGRK